MPFYEYQCKSCGHPLEVMQKVNDPPLKKCPHCGKAQLTRLMSAPVFRLKGSGWYETDFKGDQDNKKNLADKPEADAPKDDKTPAADATVDAKADAKTDANADAGAKDSSKPADKAAEKSQDKSGDKAGNMAGEKSADKAGDKPAQKTAPTESVKKPAGAGISRRGAATAPAKASPKPRRKKPAAKPKRRR